MAVKRSVHLQCLSCKHINYLSFRNPKKNPDKLEFNKHCSFCRLHRQHKETKSRK